MFSCGGSGSGKEGQATKDSAAAENDSNFKYLTEQFADLKVLRYRVSGFNELAPKQKEMLYYLYEAALCGRDIIWDQNCKYNLGVRHTLETIVNSHDMNDTSSDWKKFMVYAKRVWFSNGIHHHYGSQKILPDCSKDYFTSLLKKADPKTLPLNSGESPDAFDQRVTGIIFDPNIAPKKVNKDKGADVIQTSACGFYDGVTQKEVEDFYKNMSNKKDTTPPSYGLNSKVVKENGKLTEKVWKVGGMYGAALEKIVYWLKKASGVAENDKQKAALDLLVKYYETGDLKTFDEYNIAWVKDTGSRIDVTSGYIEVYGDPLGYKGSFESVVSIKDMEASKRIATIGANAQWFEDNSPIMPGHKKKDVKGISGKVITVVVESGDASPSTPIGINLPNANWIRQQYGSKSVNLGNIVYAYNHSGNPKVADEFYYNDEIRKRVKEFAPYADMLHTDMHEVIGHASGKLNDGVAEPHKTLKNYASTLEEARADLVALYYLMDQKLVDIGVMPSLDYGKAAYDEYIMNGMMLQLKRLKLGDQIEEDHMRNRQLIAKWVFEKGMKDKVVEKKADAGKTFFVVNDYQKLRKLFGDLLREIQRIKSEGDFKSAQELVENYGVKVDPELHKEMLDRWSKLNIAPYQGMINPKLVPVMKDGKITDVKIEYPMDFTQQMLEYGKNYSLLPVNN